MTIIVKTLHSTGALRQRCLSLWAVYDYNSENLTLYRGFETAVSYCLSLWALYDYNSENLTLYRCFETAVS